ncbi:hypothetical protein DPMN_094495 [Dreissena polymorpha]|uniref:Uncharacterized protein n=1 Tax=Dreissena polymorpha TaxID=45954 RepID=A0A9D4L5L2_DREPO|nr:hypothetical protein DPMN_094495 [Dreissena polymorpha]
MAKKNAPPTGGHFFQATGTIFEIVQDIIGTNLLTTFYDDRTINMASRKNMPRPLGGHVFPPTGTIFELIQGIVGTNRLTKKNAPPHGGHVFKACFHLFHEDRKINVASRVLTRKNVPSPGGHVFQATGIIFELVENIIGINLLTKFHEDRTIHVASRVKNAPPLGSHVFQANVTIFELIQDIIETNLLTKFHKDWTINVASRVLTRKNAPPLRSHVFQANVTIFEFIQDIIEDWTINVASRVLARARTTDPWSPGVKNLPLRPLGHPSGQTIFELFQDINETNVLTKFHDDWAKIVTSRVFKRKTARSPGGHVFQRTGTILKLNQHII